jgi:hypothetical protein
MDRSKTRKTIGGKISLFAQVDREIAKLLHSNIEEGYPKILTTPVSHTSRRLKRGQYRADPELAKLAHSIRMGNNIDKNKPPEHITFELLYKGIGEDNNKQNDMNEPTITEEEKAKLRIQMWKIWYKIMKGYNSSYGKVSRLPLSSSGNRGGGGKRKKNIKIDIESEKKAIKEFFIEKYSDNKELRENEIAYFNNTDLAKDFVETSLLHKEVVKGWADHTIRAKSIDSTIQYPNPDGYAQLYQPIANLYMYGMQLPHQFDRKKLLNTIVYLLVKKNIYNFVDLHDCGGGTNKGHEYIRKGVGCNSYDRGAQLEMWNKAVFALKNTLPQTLYYGISGYKDMTPGTLGAWESIARINDIRHPSNSVVIHCLGGAGRSGSVMLYLLLRDVFADTKSRLQNPHFGYASINEFRSVMINKFKNPSADENTANDIEYMKQELFGVHELAYASRFRQRLNRIFFFLARHFRVEHFYTYAIPTELVAILPDDEFAKPIQRSFIDVIDTSRYPLSIQMGDIDIWNNYDKQKVIEWFN